jgi:hypothetical protein
MLYYLILVELVATGIHTEKLSNIVWIPAATLDAGMRYISGKPE